MKGSRLGLNVCDARAQQDSPQRITESDDCGAGANVSTLKIATEILLAVRHKESSGRESIRMASV